MFSPGAQTAGRAKSLAPAARAALLSWQASTQTLDYAELRAGVWLKERGP